MLFPPEPKSEVALGLCYSEPHHVTFEDSNDKLDLMIAENIYYKKSIFNYKTSLNDIFISCEEVNVSELDIDANDSELKKFNELFFSEIIISDLFDTSPSSTQVIKVRRRHVKCYSCKREWSSKKFSVLEDIRVSPQKFLLVVKCFTLKLPLIVTAKEINLEPKTVRKIYRLIRGSISQVLDEELIQSGRIEFILSYDKDTQQIEMILKRMSTIDDEHSTNKVATISLKRIRRSNSEYAFQLEELIFADDTANTLIGKVAIFVKQIRSQLDNFNGRSQKECLLYLGETIFHFNNSSNEIFKKLLDSIAQNVGGR